MNILILNWRDIKNPSGGGAEILTHEMAKRWVAMGHHVTQFSSAYKNCQNQEKIDDVMFLRKGKWWTVHFFAFFYYLQHAKKIDIVIDEVHWFPFFSALYAPKKTIALTCEVANNMLFRIFPYYVALVFRSLEKIYLSLYRTVPTMVISPSTYTDLLAAGHDKQSIIILPMGLSVPKGVKVHTKENSPTIIALGRLNIQKGTEDVLNAFVLIKKDLPQSILWFVGSGEKSFIAALKQKVAEYELEDSIKFYGFVSEKEKFALLSRAHILISASIQEGWGLTLPEAGLMKTPSVVYDIEGYRDIIEQHQTGILVKKNIRDLAEYSIALLQDKKKYKEMQNNVYKNAQQYSWDKTAEVAINFMKERGNL